MAIRIVLQARMNSHRRPGKTLADLGGRPLLERCLERLRVVLRRGGTAWQLLVATTTDPEDDVVAQTAARCGVRTLRGSADDVLARYVQAAADLSPTDVVVRATADNPLYCPELTLRLVTDFLKMHDDYRGVDPLSPTVPEACSVRALRAMAARDDLDDYCHEHVTPFFRRDGTPFRARRLPPTWAGLDPSVRLTVDTPDDVAAMDRLYRTLIGLTGEDRPETWTMAQIYAVARGLAESSSPTKTDAAPPSEVDSSISRTPLG